MRHQLRALGFAFFAALFLWNAARAAGPAVDFLNPKTVTGTIYADESLSHKLFTLRRTATSDGSTINVLREFNLPNGKLAAREHVTYDNGQLKSFKLEELQTGAIGSAIVQSGGNEPKLVFDYSQGNTRKTGSERFLSEILVSDMVGPYIAAHFDALENGQNVKCRLVSVSRVGTVSFKFFKESNTTWHGKPVMMVRLQPTSIIIARIVAPLHFVVEKALPHRVFEYTGRTTPSILKNGKWEDLDAVTVFDWK